MNLTNRFVVALLGLSVLAACGKKDSSSYDFSSNVSTELTSSTVMTRFMKMATDPLKALQILASTITPFDSRSVDPCDSMFCVTPSAVSGKYFGVGLSIQADGKGMSANFGKDSWSDITGTSTAYDFDLTTPVTNTGDLMCCNGTGDLSSDNTYIEAVTFLLGYVDVTFTLASPVNGTAAGTHTVRFVLADDVITDGVRGDLLYSDSGTFKWVDSSTGSMSTTRPTSPVTMDSDVTGWENPWGKVGSTDIPVIYAGVDDSDGKVTTSESNLKGKDTYSFNFPAADLVIFPMILKDQDEGLIDSVKTMLQKIHLQGLPHHQQDLPRAGDTGITISG